MGPGTGGTVLIGAGYALVPVYPVYPRPSTGERRRTVGDCRPLIGRASSGDGGVTKDVNSDHADAYRMTAEEVVAQFGSDRRRGLDGQEAGARLRRYGPNELETDKPVPAWRSFKTS